MSLFLLILGIILFVMLVVVHEFGHFLAARRNQVDVEEFGIGFPPRAWSRKMKSGFLFSLNWLPIGGFVRLKGENDADKRPHSFGNANMSVKTKIMVAGVFMNLLTALVLLTVLAATGIPKLLDNQFTVKSDTKVLKNEVLAAFVEPNSPAAKAGIKEKDQLKAIGTNNQDDENIVSAEKLPVLTKKFAGSRVFLLINRDGKDQIVQTQLRNTKEVDASKNSSNPKGYLGISPAEYTLQRSTWSAPVVAVGLSYQLTVATFAGLGHALGALFSGHPGQASQQVAGPVGVFAILKSGSLLGYQFILMIVALISLTLAIMNILPIPALDGGRLFVTWVFHVIKKPLTKQTEDVIHGTGFALLMVLFVLITIVDVRRFF